MATAAERRAARAKLRKQEELTSTKTPKVKEAAPVHEEEAVVERVAPEERAPSATRSRNTLTVGCKVPNGLILQNHILEDAFEMVFGGGQRPTKKGRPVGNPIHITGASRAPGSDPDAKRVIGGFALTYNVPRDDFEMWMRDNAELDIVKKGLIFAHENADRAADQAKDQKSFRSGLEGLNVDGRKANGDYIDPRMPKNVKKYKPDDESTDIRGVA